MISLLTYILIFAVCGFVAYPLLRGRDSVQIRTSEKSSKILDLLFQKRLYAETIEDLIFDHQTGKLSDEDYAQLLNEQQQAYDRVEQQLKSLAGTDRNQIRRRLEAEIGRAAQQAQSANALICPACGSKVDKGDKFCSHCGTKLN